MGNARVRQGLCIGGLVCAALSLHAAPAQEATVGTTQVGSFASTGLPPQPYAEEWRRTKPDFLVFHPAPDGRPLWDDKDFCGLNEQLIVLPVKGGELLAFWTSWGPKLRWLRIQTSRSADGGKSWSKPTTLDGADVDRGRSASWCVPVVSKSGRLTCFYNKWTGVADRGHGWTGALRCRTSDDGGRTWGPPVDLPFRRTPLDHPDPKVPATWIAWKGAERDRRGRVLIAFTRWASPHSKVPYAAVGIKDVYCRCELMRLENLDDDPKPQDIQITWLPSDGGITVPNERRPEASFAQEPAVACLPDGRLFLAMRTNRGQLWYTVSADDGATWRQPEMMRFTDRGAPVLHPVSPAPIFTLADGRFLLLFNNNDGFAFGARARWTVENRRPAFLALGTFEPKARQPIWWSVPKPFVDNDGVPMGPLKRLDAAAYPSLTEVGGTRVLWYPERKHFLVGKIVPDPWLADMRPPEPPKPVNTRYAKAVRADKPLAYWCFDDPMATSGAPAADQMGRHHGSYRGGVTLAPGVPGIGGTAAAFDGRTGHVSTTTLGDFGRTLTTGSTLEFWLKTTTSKLKRQPIGLLCPDGTAFLVDFNRAGSLAGEKGRTNFFLRAVGTKRCLSGDTSATLYDGRWHHVAWVVREPAANRAEVYIDGKLDRAFGLARKQSPAEFTNFAVPFVIGAVNNRGRVSGHAEAVFDEVAVYGKPLSAERIRAHCEAATSSQAP